NDSGDSTSALRILDFHHESTTSTIDEGNLATEAVGGESLAGAGDGTGAVVHQYHVAGSAGRIERRSENGTLGAIGTGCGAAVDHDLVIALSGPQIHLHAWIQTVNGRGEIGVVGAGAILSFGVYGITITATPAKVVLLEVAGSFGESMSVQRVVDHV